MKKGNLERWKNIDGCINLLLFSQLVNELLFDYSIPSNRVSTLNSHYLCMDALNCIESIDNHGVPEGTLKPIMEELYSVLKKDPIFENTTDSPLYFFVKYQADKYVLTNRVSDMNYGDLRKTARALDTCFFSENRYYKLLKSKIVEIVESNDITRQKELFRLVKSLLTELMNSGYTLRFIYEVMNKNFWNPQTDIEQPTAINLFFDVFDFSTHEYDVVFKVNRKRMEKFVGCIQGVQFSDNLEPRFNTHGERQFLNRRNRECFLVIKKKSLEPFKAAENVKDMLSANSALYRLYDHNYRYDINIVPCMV